MDCEDQDVDEEILAITCTTDIDLSVVSKAPVVVFDLETTGLSEWSICLENILKFDKLLVQGCMSSFNFFSVYCIHCYWYDIIYIFTGRSADIIQIAAHSTHCDSFNTYVFPNQSMSKEAIDITQIHVLGNKMFFQGKEVKYKLPHNALEDYFIHVHLSGKAIVCWTQH